MSKKEIYILLILNIIFSLRMLGIFTILPVLSIYGMELKGANEALIGIAIGAYGLMQIIFQIPLGLASDKIGRKPIIVGGLLISIIGTSIAAVTSTIWGIIIGRALQGTCAISGTLFALLSDTIKEDNKTKSIMLIGLNFSITFSISIIIGPIITNIIGLNGLFISITILTLLAMILTIFYIPPPKKNTKYSQKFQNITNFQLLNTLIQPQLMKINFSVFFLHTILVLNFISLPKIMKLINLSPLEQSKIYFINISTALITSAILILFAERKKNIKKLLITSIYILFLSEIIFSYNTKKFIYLFLGSLLFFISFSIIEGILPSILTKETTKTYYKGITSGLFSTSQFLGTTCGGILGGYLLNVYKHTQIIFYLEIIITIIWIIIITSLKEPPYKH